MNIPSKLKVGGKIYTVEKTEELTIGDRYMGECIYTTLSIRIVPCKAKQMEEITFLHEMIHAIFNHLGYTNHSEKKVDELANALHMVIVDNPDIFSSTSKEGKANG